ncbi:MAG: Flp family type IVb pilin [Chloroflexi bacterium]|nr:Flp family type IVb pilin [Chloroflexota bacterium]
MNIRSTVERFIRSLHRDEDAQGLAEYALILALIAIVAIVALLFMGTQISDKLSIVGSQLRSVGG